MTVQDTRQKTEAERLPTAGRLHEGLEGIVATATRLSHVDGQQGELLIAGYPVESLAPRASFEDVVSLLWGKMPESDSERDTIRHELAALRELQPATVQLLRHAAQQETPVMDALRMAAATLTLGHQELPPRRQAAVLVAAFPSIVGSYWRLRLGLEPVAPRQDLSHAASFLHQIEGTEPSPSRARALETYLNTVVDHGLNASTFAARVIVATRSDLCSAITGAVGALKGPLHGGAPGPALDTVLAIGSVDRAAEVLGDKLRAGERLMGFGHRVYRVRDPRADVLAAEAKRFFANGGDPELYELAIGVEKIALELLREHKKGRRLDTNVEYYTALLLHGLGLPTELFTPAFAVGRVAGWTAHCLEQLQNGRLIRPQSHYIGPQSLEYPALH